MLGDLFPVPPVFTAGKRVSGMLFHGILEAQRLPAEDEASLRLWKLAWQWPSRKLIFYFTEETQARLHVETGCVGRRLPPIVVWDAGRNPSPEMAETSEPWAVFQYMR